MTLKSLRIAVVSILIAALTPVLPLNVFAEEMMNTGADMKAVEEMDSKEPQAKAMKMDEKKHAAASAKAKKSYQAALKKAQLAYVKSLKTVGKKAALARLNAAKKQALAVYTKEKKRAMDVAKMK
ncbi:MAG: hypothetical protein AAB416_01080 [Patescibacteria group bacterium]